MRAADLLPWPWGENAVAAALVASAVLRRRRFRQATRWAAAAAPDRPRRVALALCANRGRAAARRALVGLRDPAVLLRHQVVHGAEHLERARGATILLGFHLGMPNSDLAIRMAGHALTWLGRGRPAARCSTAPWRALLSDGEIWLASGHAEWSVALARARRLLLEGGTIYLTGDGVAGREMFRVPLPGGALIIRSGWLALCERTGATVLPVLSHRAGRSDVVTIHPPLPGPRSDVVACRAVLGELLADYVRRHPEQCHSLAFLDPVV